MPRPSTLPVLPAAAMALVLIIGAAGAARAEAPAMPAPVAAWSGDRWWSAYDDPQLHALIEQGLRHAPRARRASARARHAAALADGAQAAGRPGLVLHGGLTRLDAGDGRLSDLLSTGGGGASFGGAGLASGYELDLRGKVRAETAAARAEARAARADAAETALQVSVGIARTYGELAALHDLRDLVEREGQVRREMLAASRRRVEAGVAPSADSDLAVAALAQASADLAATDEAIASAEIELAVRVGVDPGAMAGLGRPRVSIAGAPIAGEIAVGGPQLAAAAARADAARHRVAAGRAAYLPSLRLLALTGVQVAGGSALFGGEAVGALGAALQLPLLDGGRRRAGLRAAEAAQDMAAAAYDEARQRRAADAASASAAQRGLAIQLEFERAAVAASDAAWIGQRRRHEAGEVDVLAVLAAEDRALAGRRRVLALEAKRFRVEIDRIEAAGGGWREAGAK